ncbi:MAG: anaerobic carbon-monoxide dehydrogenase catalytic subunit [Desulfobacterales bacterium]|nr:anaerobic carbon-monoxide dehydrogenase catalytic subunit [Desulfobacterales bacterium]
MAEEAKEKVVKVAKEKKLADPVAASIDLATQIMIKRAQELGIDTVFDRAENMKPCNIGIQGTCCKVCAMGPCRLPLTKSAGDGPDERKGLCGATANTIAARNFARMVAAGTSAHSDHGRTVAEVFLSVARKESHDYKIKDPLRLLQIAPCFDVATTVEVDGQTVDREIDEIALEVAEKAIAEWGKPEGTLSYLKRAPQPLQDKWKKHGVEPRAIDREVVDIMHRTTMGVDQDYKNIVKQCTRASLADGWGGAMMATDLQDVMFGRPTPIQSEVNLGIMKQDHVNILIHGHEPVLSEMIVAASQSKEMIDHAKSVGAKGIQLGGICCTGNEILQRHGVPPAGTFLQQELAIITGACDAMVVDVQCVFQNLANVAKCFHTKLITTHPMAKMEQENVIHIEFDEHHAMEDAKRIVRMAIDNFKNRGAEVMIPKIKSTQIAGFGVESIEYHLGGTFRGSYYTLNDNIINGRIRGLGAVVGCNNARTQHNNFHITLVKELIKNDVLVLTTGCAGIACGMHGMLTPETAGVYCGPGLKEVCETVGIPPVLHLGSCVDNTRILLAATEMIKAGGPWKDLCDIPAVGAAPEWMSEKAIAIGQYVVSSGIYTIFGGYLPIDGAPEFRNYLFNEIEKLYGGRWDVAETPIEMAQKMIAQIDKKRKELGIDKARDRVLMDMADRQKLEAM